MDQNWHEGIECVIREPLLFKKKLGIGEEAYTSLSVGKSVRQYWDLISAAGTGATVAKSTIIASAFFQPTGLMGFLGLASASTPVGWVVFAAVASAGAWYGIDKYYNKARNERVEIIPKFINTPLDVISLAIFNLMLPLSLKVAMADGYIHKSEEERIRSYFVDEWGYDERFYLAGYKLYFENLDEHQTSNLAFRLTEFQKHNPDCNEKHILGELIMFLNEIMDADGVRHPAEENEIKTITEMTKAKKPWISRIPDVLGGWWGKPKNSLETIEEPKNVIASLATHEKLLVELSIKSNNLDNKLSGLDSRILDIESRFVEIESENFELKLSVSRSKTYIRWLTLITVCSGFLALFTLALVVA